MRITFVSSTIFLSIIKIQKKNEGNTTTHLLVHDKCIVVLRDILQFKAVADLDCASSVHAEQDANRSSTRVRARTVRHAG